MSTVSTRPAFTPAPTVRVGRSLQRLRGLAGMTLAEVAAEAGTSESYLSKVETGDAYASRLYVGRIAEVLARRL